MQLCPPEIKDTPEAPRQASEKLEQMGPMTRDEKIMLGTMGFALALWVRALQRCHPILYAQSRWRHDSVLGVRPC